MLNGIWNFIIKWKSLENRKFKIMTKISLLNVIIIIGLSISAIVLFVVSRESEQDDNTRQSVFNTNVSVNSDGTITNIEFLSYSFLIHEKNIVLKEKGTWFSKDRQSFKVLDKKIHYLPAEAVVVYTCPDSVRIYVNIERRSKKTTEVYIYYRDNNFNVLWNLNKANKESLIRMHKNKSFNFSPGMMNYMFNDKWSTLKEKVENEKQTSPFSF